MPAPLSPAAHLIIPARISPFPFPLFALVGVLIRTLSRQPSCKRWVASRVWFARWPVWWVTHALASPSANLKRPYLARFLLSHRSASQAALDLSGVWASWRLGRNQRASW